ncbi:MAG: hypothetical protein QNJ45_00640 [Ardenticatenaceae bacterium]|nr:hypothetical protein [Ardenticatenaceae bacterium]
MNGQPNRIRSIFAALIWGSLLMASLLWIAGQTAEAAPSTSNWWDNNLNYRAQVVVTNDSYTRTNRPVEIAVNFTTLLNNAGETAAFDPQTIRVIEVDGTRSLLDSDVHFQFDQAADYNASTNASGTLVFILDGTTSPTTTRTFDLYFNPVGSAVGSVTMTPLITTTDNISDAGQLAFRIETPSAIYDYHKEGGGFSSLVDSQGNDWIGYDPIGTPYTYRGIPNLGFNKFFHPGYTGDSGSTSVILSSGPIKTVISSTGYPSWLPAYRFSVMWEIYPQSARLTVLEAADDYWFLYEGTPGGLMDANDFLRLSTGVSMTLDSDFTYDLPGDEWAYFADPTLNRSIFIINHTPDNLIDSYRSLNNNLGAADEMTVFGFGRNNLEDLLTGQTEFSIGLFDSVDVTTMTQIINDLNYPLTPTLSTVETNIPLTHSLEFIAADPDLQFNWVAPAGGCVASIVSSTTPYFDLGEGTTVAMGITTPYTVTNALSLGTAFYQVESSGCAGTAPLAESAEIGVFEFALEPGN